jgi:hypothetical protein
MFTRLLRVSVASIAVTSAAILAVAPSAHASLVDPGAPPNVINMSNVPGTDLPAVEAFETNAVNEVLALHSLPSSDFNSVMAYGRSDIRAQEWIDLGVIIKTPANQRTSDQAEVYDWFRQAYVAQAVAADQYAESEYAKWSGHSIGISEDPIPKSGPGTGYCNYQPPGGPSGPFAGQYTGDHDPTCFQPCTNVLGCSVDYPSYAEFKAWGAYDEIQKETSNSDFANSVVDTVGAYGISASLVAAGVSTALSASFGGAGISPAFASQLFPFLARVGWASARLIAEGFAEAGATAAETAGITGAATAGAIAFVVGVAVFFIISTVFAILTLVQNADLPKQLQDDTKNQAAATNPDLAGMLTDTSNGGYSGLFTLFTSLTMPDVDYNVPCSGALDPCAHAPVVPAPGPSEDQFLVTTTNNGVTTTTASPTIYTADERVDTYIKTRLSGNAWFVQTRYNGTDPANLHTPTEGAGTTIQNLQFMYEDWDGKHWIAERILDPTGAPEFVVSPMDPSGASICTSPVSGKACVLDTLNIVTPDDTKEKVTIVPYSAVAPTVNAFIPANVTVGTPATFTATGTDPNNGTLAYSWQIICPGSIPAAGFPCNLDAHNDISVNLGGQTVSFTFNTAGNFTVSLTVSDGTYTHSETYHVLAIADSSMSLGTGGSNPTNYGQPDVVTAYVHSVNCVCATNLGGSQLPAGAVQFYVDDQPFGLPVDLTPQYITVLGYSPPGDPPLYEQVQTGYTLASVDLSKLPVTPSGGAGHQVSATYMPGPEPSPNNQIFMQPAFHGATATLDPPIVVNEGAVSAAITATWGNPLSHPVFGQPVTLRATFTPDPNSLGALTPSGTAQFYVDGAPFADPVDLDANGVATLTTDSLPVTPPCVPRQFCEGHDITVSYDGADAYQLENDGLLSGVRVLQAQSSTSLTGGAEVTYGTATTATATVNSVSPSAATPTGYVQFTVDGANSGAPVALDSNGQASFSGILPATGSGTAWPNGHVLGATFLNSEDFGPSDSGTISATVDPKDLSVTGLSATLIYDDDVPDMTPNYSGFVNNEDPSSLNTPATCSTDYTKGSPVGTYDTTCSGAVDPNYSFDYVTGKITVGQHGLTGSVDPATMTYGGPAPTMQFNFSGFVNGDGPGVVTTAPTCYVVGPFESLIPISGILPVGHFDTWCLDGAATNYSIPLIFGTLDVTKAPLSVTASSPSITYGDPAPTISASYDGFVNSQGVGAIGQLATCTTDYVQGDGVGTYGTHCSGASATNYKFNYTDGSVTVGPATLHVAPVGNSMTYGGTVPTISSNITGFVSGDQPSVVTVQPTCIAHDGANNPVSSSTPAGTYTITCTGGTAANYNFAYGTALLVVNPAPRSVAYTGSVLATPGTNVALAAQVTSVASACVPGTSVAFSLDQNPLTGAVASYSLGSVTANAGGAASLSVGTTGWRVGTYTVTATAAATASCLSAAGSSALMASATTLRAYGAGNYKIPGDGSASFGFTVQQLHGQSFGGSLTLDESGKWLLKGSVSTYMTGSGGSATATGTGALYAWNAQLNGGAGGWQLVSSSVAFSIGFSATSSAKKPGTFGATITYSPGSGLPPLPNSTPQTLTSGQVVIN